MKTDTIDLYNYFNIKRPEGGAGYLTTYIIDDYDFCKGRIRPAMLVIAGGGYSMVSQREEEPIALTYVAQGYNAFTLNYSVAPLSFPTQLLEACMAMLYIRKNAEKLFVDPSKVAGIGFSAGGHLLGTLANLYDCEEIKSVLGEDIKLCRPDAVIYSYAVVSAHENTHVGSITNVSGGDEKIKNRMGIEDSVSPSSPPAFIWATANDQAVPSNCSLVLALAYKNNGVPFELHIFEDGVHGLSLCTSETNMENFAVKEWIPMSITWLKNRGFVHTDIKK